MLQRLLCLIADGRPRALAELARALETPEALITPMLEQLTRQGYLTEAEQCTTGCDGCPLHSACGPASGGARSSRLWTVTEKGRRAVIGDR